MNRTEPLLVDATVWGAMVDPGDRFHDAARELLLAPGGILAALDLTLYEIANAVGAKMRLPGKAAEIAGLVQDRCGARVARVDVGLVAAAVEIAAEHGLTAYDAAYVAAARRNGWSLVSGDIADLVSRGLAVAPDAALYP